MAKVTKKVPVSTVEFMVADTKNETLKKVSTRFPYKVKASNKLIKELSAQAENEGLHFVEITSIIVDSKKYEMPVESFVVLAKEVE